MTSAAIPNRMLRPIQSGLGVRHALLVYVAPRSLFTRVEDNGAYGWALLTLLGLVTLIGYAKVQSGLIDESVAKQTEKRLEELEEQQGQLVDRIQLRDRLEGVRKEAVFATTIAKLGEMVLHPLYLLGSFLLIASVLYALVALTGRKPEYHTLMSLCVYAGFIELAGYVVALGMMLHYRTMEIGTSLGLLGSGVVAKVLSGVDPFRVWFWVLVAIGLTVTQQLSRRMSVASCTTMCMLGIGLRVGWQFMLGVGGSP